MGVSVFLGGEPSKMGGGKPTPKTDGPLHGTTKASGLFWEPDVAEERAEKLPVGLPRSQTEKEDCPEREEDQARRSMSRAWLPSGPLRRHFT